MIFTLWPELDDGWFSWRIAKNPGGEPFERDLSSKEDGTRRVVGRYEGRKYLVEVTDDPAALLERLRAERRASYVDARPFSVTPRALTAAATALKSAVDGKVPRGIEREDFFKSAGWGASIGPFAYEDPTRTYSGLGLLVERDAACQDLRQAVAVRLAAAWPMSLTEFLQRVFVGAYATSARGEDRHQEEQVELLIRRSGWLKSCPNADFVVRRLSGHRSSVVARFEAALELGVAKPAERGLRLHKRRHDTVLRVLAEEQPLAGPARAVDLGCGGGELAARLARQLGADVLAIDADERAAKALRGEPRVQLRRENLLQPYLEENDLRPDWLVLCEVVEHLNASDRAELVRQVSEMWRPRVAVLTTPNALYNERLGLGPGETRHDDHQVEYGPPELEQEVLRPLRRAGYDVGVVPVDGFEDADVQPSFVVVARKLPGPPGREAEARAGRLVRKARETQAPLAVDELGCDVSSEELREGSADPVYRHHRRGAFFLAPTVAPADHDPERPQHLEHPEGAFKYYEARGVRRLVGEHKYMGSRAAVLLFADEEVARRAGMPPLAALSRSGRPLLDSDEARELWERARPSLRLREVGRDFAALDCELMPWSEKAGRGAAGGLVARSFRGPGEAALLRGRLGGDEKLERDAGRFLETLSWFDGLGEVELRPFGVVACGAVRSDGHFKDVRFGADMDHLEQLDLIDELLEVGDLFKRVDRHVVDLENAGSRAASAALWERYTSPAERGEGFVYKPLDGGLVQPALKVRGARYLELIYGMGYAEPAALKKLTRRGTRAKRRAALLEHVLAQRVSRAFFSNRREAHERLVAAFLGVDAAAGRELDGTL